MARRSVRKGPSARKFRKEVKRTPAVNMAKPARGGFRL